MSPPGDTSSSGLPTPVHAFAIGSSSRERNERSGGGASAQPSAALPIRLSVAQGGVGIELASPVKLPIVVVEELDVALLGVRYPVDLSKGVKQFRNRRSRLRKAVLRIDLQELAQGWADALVEFWGEEVNVRLRPVFESERASEVLESDGAAANDTCATTAIAVSLYSETTALAFDLVLASGDSPRFIVDCPRLCGRNEAALPFALRCLDQGISALSSPRAELGRVGRAVEINSLAEALSLAVLPPLGCRLPEVEGQVVQVVRASRGFLHLTLGLRATPFTSNLRALHLSGLADFIRTADELLSSGDLSGAREAYLTALEAAEGHVGILQELAELDLSYGHRAESALSFLGEIEAKGPRHQTSEMKSRFELSLSRALHLTGREESSFEAQLRAFESETDAVVAAALGFRLSRASEGRREKRRFLDLSVGRAPFLSQARLARFELALEDGDLETAIADAERVEAGETQLAARVQRCVEMGTAFTKAGHPTWGQKWLRRAVRLEPDNPEALLALAASLDTLGESLRSAELYQAALRKLEERLVRCEEALETVLPPEEPISRLLDHRTEARYRLAELFLRIGDSDEQALGLLSGVETRSMYGERARVLEAQLHHERGRIRSRDRSILRLLEAIELGWVEPETCRTSLLSLLGSVEKDGDKSLLDFAHRLMNSSSSETDSTSNH
jgi:tetratricopeptide (TPR) repeat protein